MFDWPEQTQTSPTRTSTTSTLFFPSIVMANGPPASSFASRTSHLPSGPASAATSCPWNLTVTFSPGSAEPQTGTDRPRWSTAPGENSGAGVTSAAT